MFGFLKDVVEHDCSKFENIMEIYNRTVENVIVEFVLRRIENEFEIFDFRFSVVINEKDITTNRNLFVVELSLRIKFSRFLKKKIYIFLDALPLSFLRVYRLKKKLLSNAIPYFKLLFPLFALIQHKFYALLRIDCFATFFFFIHGTT